MVKIPSVFLSYSSTDKMIARQISNDLMRAGIHVWFDEAEIKIGDSIIDKISHALKSADYIIALLSPSSIKSTWVQKELQYAFSQNIESAKSIIIPVLIGNIKSDEIPLFIRNIRYADLSRNYSEGLDEIIRSIFHMAKDKPKSYTLENLFNSKDLAKAVAKEVMKELKFDPKGIRLQDYEPDPKLVFVIMAFSDDMEPIFEGIKAAGEKHNLKVERVKDVPGDYRITDKIIKMINSARIIVADLTHERPNVYFELGYTRGTNKSVITIARKNTNIHFDVNDWTCYFYHDSRIVERYLEDRFAYELSKGIE
ncbi:MAG: toll/interleukin-1 receptor domain-containing protein [Dehalococcoidia bacterium]|nr:MAG: toll/interleukin-1 receptor domain-containing protein [Dehalococcoidia bacterium]